MRGRPLGTGTLKQARNRRGEQVWIGRWTDARGRYREVSLGTDRRVAARRLVDIVRKRDLALQGLGPEEGQEAPLASLVEAYLADLGSRRSQGYAKRVGDSIARVTAHLGNTAVKSLTRERLLSFRTKRLASGASNRTVNLDTGAIHTCLRWGLSQGLIGSDPVAGFKPLPSGPATQRKQRRPMTDEEIAAFRRAVELDDSDRARRAAAERTITTGTKGRKYAEAVRSGVIPQSPLWDTLLLTGIRWNEAVTLRWGDLDPSRSLLRVRAEVAKSGKGREIPVPPDLIQALLDLHATHVRVLHTQPGPWASVFLTPRGCSLGTGASSNGLRSFYALLRRAGIARRHDASTGSLDIHALRTTCGSRWAREGVPPQVVQYLLGHSDIRVTMKHYVFLNTEDARAALKHATPLPSPRELKPHAGTSAVRFPWNKPGTADADPSDVASAHMQKRADVKRGLNGGPRRTRTYDQAIMSHLL